MGRFNKKNLMLAGILLLSLVMVASADGGTYSTRITDVSPSSGSCGSIITASAHLERNTSSWQNYNYKTISFTLGTSSNSSQTNSTGIATAILTVPAGAAWLNASFSGNSNNLASFNNTSFTVTGSCGGEAPSITVQPVSITKTVGELATFSVTATGTPTLHYQWKKDGSNVGTDSNSYSISSVDMSNAGSYNVTVTNGYGSVTSSLVTLTVNKATATVLLSDLTKAYTGSSLTPTVTTIPSGLAIDWTNAPQTNAGSYAVTATVNDVNYAGSAIDTFVINKAPATVSLSDLTKTYTGGSLTPTATTIPSGLAIDWTNAPQTNAGSYAVTATVNDTNYDGSAIDTFVINKAPATVSLSDLTKAYTGSSLTPTVTTIPSGLAIDWTNAPQTNAGSYAVTATVNDVNYAGSAIDTFVINKAPATVSLSDLTKAYTGSSLTPTVTTIPSGLAIDWTNAPQTNAGSYAVTATVNDVNYNGSASDTFVINKATATLTLGGLSQVYDGTPKSVTVTTDPSGLDVVSITYAGSPDAPSAVGSYAVVAALTNDNYIATNAEGTLEISAVPKSDQTITFDALSARTFGDPSFDVNATASSGLPVSFSILSGPATVSGVTITITGAGSVTVRASQIGNDTYNAATDVDQTFSVSQAIPIITWANPADITYGTALGATQLNAEASVPGGFVYTPAAGIVLSIGADQTLHAAFTPTDPTNYTAASKNVTINVTGTLPSVRYINGTVTNSSNPSEALAGVKVTTGSLTTYTDPSGKYSFAVVSGSYDLTFTYDIRYYTGSLTGVSTETVAEANGDFALQLKPVGTISGSVTVGDLIGWVW